MLDERKLFKTNELGIELYYKLELDGLPEAVYEIPEGILNEEANIQHDGGRIAKFYKRLLYEFGNTEFNHLTNAKIHFLWKSKGGKNGGRRILGKCKKPTGELRFYADADYVIVFSADHCSELNENKMPIKNWQILALLFHELKHTCIDKNGKFSTKGHDFEGFHRELELFGGWKSDAEQIIKTSQKLPLFEGVS